MYEGHHTALVPNSLRGYRCWVLSNNRLKALYRHTYWDIGIPMVANCNLIHILDTDSAGHLHSAPHIDCTCGIYVKYEPLFDNGEAGELVRHINGLVVFGAIDASGKILMGTSGFRAEKAVTLGLTPLVNSVESHDEVERFCQDKGIRYYSTANQLVKCFPPEDLISLGVQNHKKIVKKTTSELLLRGGS